MGKFNTEVGSRDLGYVFYCPACKYDHYVRVSSTDKSLSIWTVTGVKEDKPTVSPSLLINARCHQRNPKAILCHSFIRDGKIQYLNDCTHSMAGQTIEIPDYDEAWA